VRRDRTGRPRGTHGAPHDIICNLRTAPSLKKDERCLIASTLGTREGFVERLELRIVTLKL
jgi:hypothetical protein